MPMDADKKLKLYTIYSPSHARLFHDYLLPGVECEFEVRVCEFPQFGDGGFGTRSFAQATSIKANWMLQAVEENPGETVVWLDADILVLRPICQTLLAVLGSADFATQVGGLPDELNSGCYIVRSSPKTVDFFQRVALDTPKCYRMFDQEAFNLHKHRVSWRELPPNQFWHPYFALGDFWNGDPEVLRQLNLPPELQLCHACWIKVSVR